FVALNLLNSEPSGTPLLTSSSFSLPRFASPFVNSFGVARRRSISGSARRANRAGLDSPELPVAVLVAFLFLQREPFCFRIRTNFKSRDPRIRILNDARQKLLQPL